MARALLVERRRRGRPRRPRPLVPGVGRHLGARARGRSGPLLLGPLACLARRAGRARARAGRDIARREAEIARMRAVRRAVSLQGDQGAPGAVEAEGHRAPAQRHARDRPAPTGARSRSRSARPSASAASCWSSSDARLGVGAGRMSARSGRCGWSAASTSAWSAPTARARSTLVAGAGRASASSRPASCAAATTSSLGYLAQHTEVGGRAERRRCSRTPSRRRGSRRRRVRGLLGRFLFSGDDVKKRLSRPLRRRGAAARPGPADQLGREPADPRRAHQPPRPRESRGARGRADGLRRHRPADLPRPRPARGGRDADAGDRGRPSAQPPRRLGRVPGRSGGATRAGREAPPQRPAGRAPAAGRQPSKNRRAAARAARARGRGGRGRAARARGRARRRLGVGGPGTRGDVRAAAT